jgi:tetratricopeptide (TPR) repeat protein
MKKLIYILSILILGLCGCKSFNHYYSEAKKLEAEGKYVEAIILLDKAIEKKPENIYALLDRAVDKSLLKNYKGAIEDYSKIIKIDSNNTLAYMNRGKNKKRLEDYKGAIDDFDKAIKTKGGELLWMEKTENSWVNTGYEFEVNMEEIRFERGLARYETDSLRKAFEDFNVCIQFGYELAASYYMTGLIYIASGNIDEGCKILTKSKEYGDLNAQEMIDKYCGK